MANEQRNEEAPAEDATLETAASADRQEDGIAAVEESDSSATEVSEASTEADADTSTDTSADTSADTSIDTTSTESDTGEEQAEPHTMAEIDQENLEAPEEVQAQESAPPVDQKDEMPADAVELRQAAETESDDRAVASTAPSDDAAADEVKSERKLGPLTPSMWFLGLTVVAFLCSLVSLLVG